MGGASQIEAELLLLNESNKFGPFQYYHLISGVDMPIKSQDYIHQFFDSNIGKEFLGFVPFNEDIRQLIRYRIGRYWLLQQYNRSNNAIQNKIRMMLNKIVRLLPRKMEGEYRKGSNWFSITEKCTRYVLANEKIIRKRYKYTFCSDEIFMQTLVYNNLDLRQNLFSYSDGTHANMRYIDWSEGHPHVWTIEDKDKLQKSDKLFARKFSDQNIEIVNWIKDYLL